MGGRTGNSHWNEGPWDNLCKQLCADFGPELAAKIIESIIRSPAGGERITIPSLKDLQIRDRNRRICNYHRGDIAETAARFGLHENTVRQVLLRQKLIDRGLQDDEYSP